MKVRAAVVYALGTFMGGSENSEQRTNIELNLSLTLPVGNISNTRGHMLIIL